LRILFVYIAFIVITMQSYAQDSTGIAPSRLKGWSGGIFLGVSYPALTQSASSLFETEAGFTFGIQVDYDNFFFRLDGSIVSGKVLKSFDRGQNWPSDLPLSGGQGFWAFGLFHPIGQRLFLKSMIALSDLSLHNDGDVKRQANISHLGFGVGIVYSPPRASLLNGFDLMITVGWPYLANQRDQFSGAMWRLSLGLIFIPMFGH
jgi:hypothetical protein